MRKQFFLILSLAAVGFLLPALLFIYGLPALATPGHIRVPQYDHYHFRTQIVVDGQPVNFAEDKFQQTYPGACSEEISESPIHFHDGLDQITHIHWDGITGGEVLKYYGWNFIGGRNDSLGTRFDTGFGKVANVPILGNLLPAIPEGSNFYVYTGDQDQYTRREWNDFLNQDLEYFFGKKVQMVQAGGFDLSALLFKKASAHAGHDHSADATLTNTDLSQEQLEQINNLIGNVVIFVQPNEPSDEQIKERFNNLVPLQPSACGG